MLITTEVEVQANYNTYKHYEDLGYEIPKNSNGGYSKKRFKVKVEHLSYASAEKVELSCDGCGKHSYSKYCDYYNHNHNGLTYCQPCYNKLFNCGTNNPHYNFNITEEERQRKRNYPEYKDFIKRVMLRDNYTCQCCGKSSTIDLEVHHLNGYDWCIEGRTDDTNGITLCNEHHKAFHAVYGYGNNTKEQFEKWFGKNIELIKNNEDIPTCRQIYCFETDTVYDSVQDIKEKLNLNDVTHIYKVCSQQERYKTICGYHILWYDKYLQMTSEDIQDYLSSCNTNKGHKKVICLETLEIFDKISDANKKYCSNRCGVSQIIRACKNFGNTAHCLKDGTRLHWMYYTNYLLMSQEEIEMWKNAHLCDKKIICVITGEIFNTIADAEKVYKVHSIGNCCRGHLKTSGKLPDGTRLKWMYYSDFLKLPIEEQNEILNRNTESSTDGSFFIN